MKPLFLLLLLAFSGLVFADNQPTYNRISFSVSEGQEVNNDTLKVTMSVFRKGRNLATLSNQVNEIMDWALKTANRYENIKTKTLNYQTSPTYTKGKQTGWQVTQNLQLSSRDTETVSDLMSKLQSKLKTDSAVYSVSVEKQDTVKQTLTQKVLEKFAERAQMITTSLQRKNYKIVNLSVNTGNHHQPRPMMMARSAMMESDVAAPAFQGGSQRVSVNLSATIEVSDD